MQCNLLFVSEYSSLVIFGIVIYDRDERNLHEDLFGDI